ncbi:MAG TPA: 2-phosphosulfolactate phosphatase [Longimicrobiales bacterium]
MRIDVYFTPGELGTSELGGRIAVVIDVLRATSTIVEALANGARTIFPTQTADDAVQLAQVLGRQDVLLCGERRGLKIPGFDLGNSPLEFTAGRVAGKVLVMATTNGTPALSTCAGARQVVIAALSNLDAVVTELAGAGEDVAVVCAGRERRFALEDALCAGMLALRLRERLERAPRGNDAAAVAMSLARRATRRLESWLHRSAAGRQLREIGHGDDVMYCATVDRHSVVPRLRERQVSL